MIPARWSFKVTHLLPLVGDIDVLRIAGRFGHVSGSIHQANTILLPGQVVQDKVPISDQVATIKPSSIMESMQYPKEGERHSSLLVVFDPIGRKVNIGLRASSTKESK